MLKAPRSIVQLAGAAMDFGKGKGKEEYVEDMGQNVQYWSSLGLYDGPRIAGKGKGKKGYDMKGKGKASDFDVDHAFTKGFGKNFCKGSDFNRDFAITKGSGKKFGSRAMASLKVYRVHPYVTNGDVDLHPSGPNARLSLQDHILYGSTMVAVLVAYLYMEL